MQLTKKDWLFATRPWSFTVSALPAIVALFYIINNYPSYNLYLGILAIFGAVIFHAGGNLLSDYFDYKNGIDREGVLGIGTDNLTSKRFSPKQILNFGVILIILGVLLGLFLTYKTGITVLLIGLLGFIGTVFYSKFKEKALGEVLIFLVYGPIITLGTGFVMIQHLDWNLFLVSLPLAFITVNVLNSNNTRDIQNDKLAGITTLPMIIGTKTAVLAYFVLTVLSYLSILLMVTFKILPIWSLITFLTIPLAVKNCLIMAEFPKNGASPIYTLDKKTAQFQLAFSGLFSISLLVSILC